MCGRSSPKEREAMYTKLSEPWNTDMPIKYYIKRLEEIFIFASKYSPGFKMTQMVGNAKTAMEK